MSELKKYSTVDMKQAMKAAGLTTAERHRVYCNLPGAEPERTLLAAAGCRLYLKLEGQKNRPVIVAACTREQVGKRDAKITVWEAEDGYTTSHTYRCSERVLFGESSRNGNVVTGATNGPTNEYSG